MPFEKLLMCKYFFKDSWRENNVTCTCLFWLSCSRIFIFPPQLFFSRLRVSHQNVQGSGKVNKMKTKSQRDEKKKSAKCHYSETTRNARTIAAILSRLRRCDNVINCDLITRVLSTLLLFSIVNLSFTFWNVYMKSCFAINFKVLYLRKCLLSIFFGFFTTTLNFYFVHIFMAGA